MRAALLATSFLLASPAGPRGAQTAPPAPDSVRAAGVPAPGWAGPDLFKAIHLATESGQAILVLYRQADSTDSDALERLLTLDPQIAPLTEPFLRLRLSGGDPHAAPAIAYLRLQAAPAVVLLGPGGREATRLEGRIDRLWLFEQLQIVARRTAPLPNEVRADAEGLRRSLGALEDWGDREGIVILKQRLGENAPAADQAAAVPPAESLPRTEADVLHRLASVAEPALVREEARRLAESLEDAGEVRLALLAYNTAEDRLGTDPLLESRAAFLAARHGLDLESVQERLAEGRRRHPSSLPELMALARVAERSGRLYLAFHTLETASIYAPDDAWVALELQRLRLLVRLRGRDFERDPL
jgi:hypothetical protein